MGEVVDGVDMRAEVGLLTRNIRVQSEMESSCYGYNHCHLFQQDTFGGHIKVSSLPVAYFLVHSTNAGFH